MVKLFRSKNGWLVHYCMNLRNHVPRVVHILIIHQLKRLLLQRCMVMLFHNRNGLLVHCCMNLQNYVPILVRMMIDDGVFFLLLLQILLRAKLQLLISFL